MARQLKPRILDIVLTKITPHRVYYTIFVTGVEEYWQVPNTSTFDRSNLQIGKRYKVKSKVIVETKFNFKAQQYLPEETFEWEWAIELMPKEKSQARTKREREFSETLSSMKIAGDDLFSW